MTAVETANNINLAYVNLDLIRRIQRRKQNISVREYTGKRLDTTKRSTLICFGGKRVAKKEFDIATLKATLDKSIQDVKSNFTRTYQPKRLMKKKAYFSTLINNKIKKPKRAQKINYSSIINTGLNSLKNNISILNTKIQNKALSVINNLKNNELVLLKTEGYYLRNNIKKQANIAKIKLERLNLTLKKNYLALMSKIYAYISTKYKDANAFGKSISCIALAAVLTITSLASFKREEGTTSEAPTDSKEYIDIVEGQVQKIQPDLLARVDLEPANNYYAKSDTVESALEEETTTTTIEEPEVEEKLDEVETLDLEPEASSIPDINVSSNLTLTDNSSNSNLIYFNPNEFYRCPDSVSTKELLDIFGITEDQFYNKMFGTVYNEAFATKNGYIEVYTTFYVLINRICYSNWIDSHGTNIYNQMTAPAQFSVYLEHTYKAYSQYPENLRAIALQAMRDAMYNFIVDPTHAPHEWANFRADESWSYSSNKFTPDGNHYKTENHNYKVIYPDFLNSDAAVALRNQALGITITEQDVVYDSTQTVTYSNTYSESTNDIVINGETYTYTSGEDTLYPDSDMTLNRTLN